jgi:hypothetical protein
MKTILLDTGLWSVYSKKASSATPLFVPMTGPINTTFVKEARASRWIEGATPKYLSAWGYQMSDDANDWSTTATAVDSFVATTGWIYNNGSITAITTDQRLFVRFGVFSANDTGSSDVEQALARLRLEIKAIEGATIAAADRKVFSKKSTANRTFHPLVGPVPIEAVGEHRASQRLFASSGLADIIPAYQVSDDQITWNDGESGAADTFSTFGSSRSSAGIDYGTTFTTFAPTEKKRWVRWGAAVKNSSGTSIAETGQASLRIDYRRTT